MFDKSFESSKELLQRKEGIPIYSISEEDYIDSSSENSGDVVDDSPQKIIQSIEELRDLPLSTSPQLVKRIFYIFIKERSGKEFEISTDSILLEHIIKMLHNHDDKRLDKIETSYLSIYNPIERHRIRCINHQASTMFRYFIYDGKNLYNFILILFDRKFSSTDHHHSQLVFCSSMLKLVLAYLEYGLLRFVEMKELLFQLFLKTEQLFKIELFIAHDHSNFKDETFEVAMDCKSFSSRILLQLVLLNNDHWFYQSYLESTKPIIEDPSIRKSAFCFPKKSTSGPPKQEGKSAETNNCSIFFEETQFYSLFSFMMFNYLLHELKRGTATLECSLHKESMHQLILFVSNHKEDMFMMNLQLLQQEYLNYYQLREIEIDFIRKANTIVFKVDEVLELFNEIDEMKDKRNSDRKKQHLDQIESGLSQVFSQLEMLMGLQDDKCNIRLMLTEKKIPFYMVKIFNLIQIHFTVDQNEEIFTHGIKVLNQMCAGNYPGLSQILRGEGWMLFKDLLIGDFGIFCILFLKQIFETNSDKRYIHLHVKFSQGLISIYKSILYKVQSDFKVEKIGETPKDMVFLYLFSVLMLEFTKNPNCDEHIRQNYELLLSSALHDPVIHMVIPILRDNTLLIDEKCELNLFKKNWKLEDSSFLISLSMLAGSHLKGIVMDFCMVSLRVYNKASQRISLGSHQEEILAALPLDLTEFGYLLSFENGIVIKTEILITYCTFKVFASSTRIPETYSANELSTQTNDTNDQIIQRTDLFAIVNLIKEEISSLEILILHNDEYIDSNIAEYILKGICHITFKFINGLVWSFSGIDSEDNVKFINKSVHELNQKFHFLRKLILKYKKMSNKSTNFKSSAAFQRTDSPLVDGEHMILNNSISTLLFNLTDMLMDTEFEWILTQYELNRRDTTLNLLEISQELLQPIAGFKYFRNSGIEIKHLPKGNQINEELDRITLKYFKIKVQFISNHNENTFFKVLQSKMGSVNQTNLVAYIMSWLGSLEIDPASPDSLWVNKAAVQMIIFLDNTMFWCPQARLKLFLHLEKLPEKREKLLSTVYKMMRDSFNLISYAPYFNRNWETTFASYYICSSFIMCLCKENCQEFKILLGDFVPNLGCSKHLKLKQSLLMDCNSVLTKYLYFSGLSFNKSNFERPSDRLNSIQVVEIMIRTIIDMLTGPCKPNQLKSQNQGNLIWLNIFNRLILDSQSKYYLVGDIALDYLLSMIEGNNPEIMNSLASSFDIPSMYSFMSNTILLLHRRISSDNSVITKKTNKDEVVPLKRSMALKRLTQTARMSTTKGKDPKPKIALKQWKKDSSTSLGPIQEEYKLENWQKLIEIYKNGLFDSDISLHCCIKIFIFLSRVAYTSKKYQIFFDKKEKDLQEQFVKSGFKEEEIKANKAVLHGKTAAPDDLIIYYFMKSITSRVEIKDNNNISEIFIFPKPPCCFFLKETTKLNFINTCQIENTEAKIIDMFENFEQFQVEMKNYQAIKIKYRKLGFFISDRSFTWFRKICYLISALINLLMLVEVGIQDQVVYTEGSQIPVLILSCMLIVLSSIMLVLWIMGNYYVAWSSALKMFTLKYPYKNPMRITNLIQIFGGIFLRREVINFILHIIFALYGITGTPFAQTLHLILIINISDTTKYVLKAVTQHSDQLLATVSLVTIIIYIFSFIIGKYFSDEFRLDAADDVRICSTLKSCYLSVLNLGLTRGGGISESMRMTDISSETTNFYYKLIVVMGFYIFVNIICLNVIFGIIIDTFSELRDRQRMREWDQLNVCDICGIERKSFEKKGMNFDLHKGVQHNLWDYVFYLEYLQTLDLQSLTGFEYFVYTQFKKKSIAWLPISNTLFLKDSKEDSNVQINQLEKKMNDFRAEIVELVDSRFDSLAQMVQGIGKKVDRALLSLKETRDVLEGEEREVKESVETGKDNEWDGAIKIIDFDD